MGHLPLGMMYLYRIHALVQTVWPSEAELEPQFYCFLALGSWTNYVNLPDLSFFI